MQKRNNTLLVVIILIIVGVAGYYGYQTWANNNSGKLTASGTIEAVEVNVSPESSGKVKEVLADEDRSSKWATRFLIWTTAC